MKPIKKRPVTESPPLTVKPNGGGLAAGHEFLMRQFDTRIWLDARSGEMGNPELVRYAIEAVIDSSVDGDPMRLDPLFWMEVASAWVDAQQAAAVPPANGASSPTP